MCICPVCDGGEGDVRAGRRSWRAGQRLSESEREEQVVAGREDQVGRDRCQLAGEVNFLLSWDYIPRVCQVHNCAGLDSCNTSPPLAFTADAALVDCR
jgi:hypothetical protein